MIMYLIEKIGIKPKLAELYQKSKVFRRVVNYFGMSAGASGFLFALGGSCPFCGGPMGGCPLGILGILLVSAVAAGIIIILLGIGKFAGGFIAVLSRKRKELGL